MSSYSNFVLPSRPKWFVPFSGFVSMLRWAILALILLLIAPLGLDYVENSNKYLVTREVYSRRAQVLQFAAPYLVQAIPTRIAGKDRTEWFLLAGLVLLSVCLGSFRRRVLSRFTARQMRSQVDRWKKSMQLKDDSKAALQLKESFDGFEKARTVDRHQLLQIFAETKKKLDSMGREVAFLAVDVADSSGMKEGEDSSSIQHDFDQYRLFVDRISKTRGAMKSAWTPDGVMICFSDIEAAVQAGKEIIEGLDEFNRNIKLIRRDFSVRCGVNAGFVHYDPAAPLETISDRVIDIAGHMQKHADPNTVAVARKVIEPLRDLRGFELTTKVVDGYEVSRWTGEIPHAA